MGAEFACALPLVRLHGMGVSVALYVLVDNVALVESN